VSGLAAGTSNSATTTLTLPAGLTGSHYVGAIVDAEGQVPKSDETNNARAGNRISVGATRVCFTYDGSGNRLGVSACP
jgi:hypothetical protein